MIDQDCIDPLGKLTNQLANLINYIQLHAIHMVA